MSWYEPLGFCISMEKGVPGSTPAWANGNISEWEVKTQGEILLVITVTSPIQLSETI